MKLAQYLLRILNSSLIYSISFIHSISLILGICLILSGCGQMKIEQFKDSKPELVLEQYFSGKTQASGILFGRSGEVKRQFTVDMQGTWDGKELILEEFFNFDDGEKQHRRWVVKKLDANHYQGTAGDVIGIAEGKQFGSALNWSYVLRVPVGEKSYDITFDDWMFLQKDGTLLNRAVMRKFGFKVGELFLAFKKL